MLLPGAVVERGALVVDSIIAGHVGADAEVRDSVIGSAYRIPDRAVVIGERLPRPE